MKTLGERIRFIRGEETQAEFADRVGIAKGSIGGYENDKNSPSADAILKICLANDISCEWLLKGHGAIHLGNEKQSLSPETNASIIPQHNTNIEKILISTEEERRELATENRRLYREKEALLREIGELREKLARLEAERDKHDTSEGLGLPGFFEEKRNTLSSSRVPPSAEG